HPTKAIVLSEKDSAGQVADKGTIGSRRPWLIRTLKQRFHLIVAGHIHRPNVLVIEIPRMDPGKTVDYHGEGIVKNVPPEDAPRRGLPLFVNTTSTGPLGNRRPKRGPAVKVASGHAEIVVTGEGKVESVKFVDDPRSMPPSSK